MPAIRADNQRRNSMKDKALTAEERNVLNGLDEISEYMDYYYFDWHNQYGNMNNRTIAFARKAILDQAKRRADELKPNEREN